MPLKQTIQEDLTKAIKEKNELVTSTLRMILTAITNTEIEKRKKDEGLDDKEIVQVLNREVKKRRDAIAEYTRAERQDLAQKEQAEIDIIKKYLPEEISEKELNSIILNVIKNTNAQTMADFAPVMKEVMSKVQGRADGAYVAQLIKKKLK